MSLKRFLKHFITFLLTLEARLVLSKYKPEIIAVAGSVGKTSTKDAIYSVLSRGRFIRKSDKSFNSEIGVPLTILGLHNAYSNPLGWLKNLVEGLLLLLPNNYPEALVLEVGADKPGDIEDIVSWLKPNMAVGTHFPDIPVHVEFFEGPKAVMDEDALIFSAVPREGVVVLNHDDPNMMAYRENLEQEIVTYGFSSGADVVGSRCRTIYHNKKPDGISVQVVYKDEVATFRLHGALGKQHAYPLLAAAAVGVSRGMRLEAIAEQVASHSTPPGRMKLLAGIKDTLLIDDTYNSSPIAAERALTTLQELEGANRRIAAMGDMLELGRFSADEHARIGAIAGESVDILIAVGVRARRMAEGARDAGLSETKIFHFENSLEAGKFLQTFIEPNDYILIKGSQSIRMERATEEIMAAPEFKRDLLVRQDAFWLRKA